MNLNDLKDQLREQFESLKSRILASPLWERFEALPPHQQKNFKVGTSVVLVGLLLSGPTSCWMSSRSLLAEFEDHRNLLRQYLKAHQTSLSRQRPPQGPDAPTLTSSTQTVLERAQLRAEQLGESRPFVPEGPSRLVRGDIEQVGLEIPVKKLNLEQITNLGYNLIRDLGPGVRMTDLELSANPENGQYYDAIFRIVSYRLKDETPEPGQKTRRRQ